MHKQQLHIDMKSCTSKNRVKRITVLFCVVSVVTAFFYFSKEREAKMRTVFHKIVDDTLYISTAMVLEPISHFARLVWASSLIFPWASTLGKEFLLFSHLCHTSAMNVLRQVFKETPSSPLLPSIDGVRPAHASWQLNHTLLSQIHAAYDEEKQLLAFLQKRWLAKATGFYPFMVNWVCPCFEMCIQIHPETTSSYSRNPCNKFSQTYTDVVKDWKQSLPHPQYYPLVLTRPFDIQDFLPNCLDISKSEQMETIVQRLALKMRASDSQVIIDLTQVLPEKIDNQTEWDQMWRQYRVHFLQKCREHNINPDQMICIQKVRQQAIGGIRILPLLGPFVDRLECHFQYLLEWISTFGLSANRIELDRYCSGTTLPISESAKGCDESSSIVPKRIKEEFLSDLSLFEQAWTSEHPHEKLLVKGTLQILEGLFVNLSEEKWHKVIRCPTRSSVVQISILKIKEQLNILLQKKNEVYFFDLMEQIHANISSLLELFAPFSFEDFPSIYKNALTIPSELKRFTSCGVHPAGMTSLRGIFKAVEKTLGVIPRVLYGENTYFECIHVAEQASVAYSLEHATDEDLKQADLILAQFNPALRRIDFEITQYRVEKVIATLRKIFSLRREKPLTLALDCTLDFIDSPRVSHLLNAFQQEIEAGLLNIICYRSGLKFDLFGMDNYCGAPFFMIHNSDAKWADFDSTLHHLSLQTDLLSLNWFCLAYKCAASQLELYRKQIFDNTRALLNKVPKRLFHQGNNYRIIPVEEGADLAFIDFKVFGPLHAIKGGLAGGSLYLKCMEKGHPIFYRPSLGLYHPNFSMLFCDNFTTIRLTLGLDPAQIDVLAKIFELIDSLNE